MSCNIKPNQTGFYIPEKDNLDDFAVDQTVIIKEEYLSKVSFVDYKKDEETCTKPDDLYLYTNSYYNHIEDADPLSKVHSLLAQPSDTLDFRAVSDPNASDLSDAYSEAQAQIKYLESKPLSFIVLGKPDIGQQELARELATYWKCVYIEPQTLIEEEIECGSRAGECIEFNLRCGRAIGIDVILKLVEQKVKAESAKHRGFVLCGLPVVPNDLYEDDPVSSESAIFTAKDIFEEVYTATADLCIAPSNPQVSVSSKYESQADMEHFSSVADETSSKGDIEVDIEEREDIIDIGKNYAKQLDFLFNLLEEPYFIVYIQCGTIDVLNKRDSYRFDVFRNKVVDIQRRTYNRIFKQDELDDTLNEEDFRMKHLVKLPVNFKANVSSQLDLYHYMALNFIQNRVLAHNREYFVKVDGRTSIPQMLAIVKAKLRVMNVQRVVIPNKLADDDLETFFKTDLTLLGEDGDTPRQEDEQLVTPLQCFKQLRKRKTPSRSHMWCWSKWGTKCPVSMKAGFIVDGSAKYPVQFMNKIYFLADQEAYFKFYQNPRPFLLPPFPRPSCRIFLFGPKRSGRSALAHCLAYYLGGSVLSADDLMHKFMQQRQDEFLDKIRQQAIAEAIALLNKARLLEAEEQERLRIEHIKEWVRTVIGLLEDLIAIYDEIEKQETTENFEISSFPMAMKTIKTEALPEDSEFATALDNTRRSLDELNIPIYKLEAPVWKSFTTERRKLLQYLPAELAQKATVKPATVFDDFVKDYVAAALANSGLNSMQLSGGGLVELFINHMRIAEDKYRQQGFARGGWIVDGMMCNLKILQDFFPDNTGDDIIVLHDRSNYLVKNYEERKSTFFRDFRGFFTRAGMQDAAWRSPSATSNQAYKEAMAKDIIGEILESGDFYDADDDVKIDLRTEEYKKHLQGFQSDWEDVSRFYLNNNVVPIEVDVSGKTLPELFMNTIQSLESKYGYVATAMTEEDRAEEVMNVGNQDFQDHSGGEGTAPATPRPDDVVHQVRKYGDTLHFCPVTFTDSFVLWKGKEDFAVKYNQQVYLLATKSDMQKFLDNPCKYLPAGYAAKLPPPRICLIGVAGSGKTHLSKSLAENYGLPYLSYEQLLKKWFNISTSETLSELATNSMQAELRSYLSTDAPLPERVSTNLKAYWFEEPFKSKGFVFDDFPKNRHDVSYMIANKMIPDLVLYPRAAETYLRTKFLDRYLKSWQESIDNQRQENELRHSLALEKWREQRSVRFNELLEKRREERYSKKLETALFEVVQPDDMSPDGPQTTSLVSFDSVADQKDVDEVNKIVDSEFQPIIVYDIPVEHSASFISKTEALISNRVHSNIVSIGRIKETCLSNNIPFLDISLDLDQITKTKVACYLAVEPIKFRNRSCLESCYDVSLEVADDLLRSGYIFLSKFGKTCPVQYYENETPIQLYQVAENNNNMFPVIHRSYIYFIVGHERSMLFKNDPLKFIKQTFKFPLVSYRVAVTGPPKCGKTALSKRIEKEFGFKLLTRGQAARYVLQHLFESDLAKSMESVLRKGWELTDEMIVKSVEAATFDARATSQGVVFDGFPNSLNEARHLACVDLVPNITIDLEASRETVLERLSLEDFASDKPKFGPAFMTHLYDEWSKEGDCFRKWFDKEYQVMAKIATGSSLWSVWHQSKRYLLSTFAEINHYHKHIADDWPLRLGNMLITPLEFLERQSGFKAFCPVCLHFSNSLVNGGDPPDRTGLVQFRQYFYWLCDNHVEYFLHNPEQYLPPYNHHGMPANLPKRQAFESIPDNVYEQGACAVCYKRKRTITKGELALCCTFNDKVYLFDCLACLNVFMKNPQDFMFEIEFRAPAYPELKYKDLPVLGMLEQYLASYVVKGLSFIAKRRPVIPGLDISTSALVGLGLFIKTKNDNPNSLKSYYEEALRLYNERRENLLAYLDFMKTHRNPYLYYEEPLPQFQLPPASVKSESLTTMVSRIVDKCVDNIDMYLQGDDDSTESVAEDF